MLTVPEGTTKNTSNEKPGKPRKITEHIHDKEWHYLVRFIDNLLTKRYETNTSLLQTEVPFCGRTAKLCSLCVTLGFYTLAVNGSQSKYFEYMTKPTTPQRRMIPHTATRLVHIDLATKSSNW